MAENGPHSVTPHRHARRPSPEERRRRVLLTVIGVLVVAGLAAVLVVLSGDRSEDADAEPAAAVGTPPPPSPPAATPAPTTSEATPTPDVPGDFAAAIQRIGIPLDPQTGWVVAQGICVRLGQPQYDQFRMSEGVERLFPWVPDEKAHEFVAMVAESRCSR